jgi:hypothetical protein
MTSALDQLLNFLNANQADPLTYLFLFFLFSIAAAVFLPIPIEIGLIWNPGLFFPLKALDLGLGKAVGAVAVFYIPSWVRSFVRWLRRRNQVIWIAVHLRAVARKTGADQTLCKRRPFSSIASALWAATCRLGLDKRRELAHEAEKGSPEKGAPAVPMPARWGWLRWLSRKSEKFTRKYGVLAMYFLMSIPGMVDTVPLYVFSIINKDRTLIRLRDFTFANFLAGINRAFIIFALLEILGMKLF